MLLPQLAQKLGQKYRDLGLIGTLRHVIMRVIDVTHDYAFDYVHCVDTAGADLPTIEQGQGYKGSLPSLVRTVLRDVTVPYQDYTFIDLGSGKGRTLLIASEFPFRRIIGVEADPLLNEVAQSNLSTYRTGNQRCKAISTLCADVRDFDFPLEPLVLYLFNPFTESVIRQLLENLRASLAMTPRPVFVIYLRPLCKAVMEASDFLQRISYRKNPLILNYSYAVYANVQLLREAIRDEMVDLRKPQTRSWHADAQQAAR